jgi:hypothetical protein
MGGGPAFARVYDFAGEQCVARSGETHSAGAFDEVRDHRLIEVCLGPIEIEPRDFEAETAQPIRLGLEQLLERLLLPGRHARRHIMAAPLNATPA